jgi:choline dehydrogenase
MHCGDGVTEFDYVIVGAGSAGCVLANRLSADGKNAVLLLEAGPEDKNLWIHVPLGYGRLFKEKTVNWMYQTEPEPGLNGRAVFQPRGKVLGGSSSINGLLYVRGQHEDYDRWRQRGNDGWGFDDVLPYFKKAENQERGADDFHGVGGPLPVSNLGHPDPISAAFIAAAVETGIPFNPDFNGATQEGAGFFQTTTRRAGGRARRSPISARRWAGTTCMSRVRRWRSASSSPDAGPTPSSTAGKACCVRRGRARKS